MRITMTMGTFLLGGTLMAACSDGGKVLDRPQALGSKECIGDDSKSSQACTPRPELWECQRSGQAASCRRAPLPAPDHRSFTCEHKGVGVSCETEMPGASTEDSWSCSVKGKHTACATKGSLIPPSGVWKCHVEDMGLECEGQELEPGDDKGGAGELEPNDDKGGMAKPGDDRDGGVKPIDDKGGMKPGDDKGGMKPGDDKGGTKPMPSASGHASLPYDVRPQLGQSFRLTDAFLLAGPLPAAVLGVSMDGGSWRLAELKANTLFVITQADCTHQGNRDVGRDRVFVTWSNSDGSVQTDHLDLRYCKN